jgi:hypothetical protein
MQRIVPLPLGTVGPAAAARTWSLPQGCKLDIDQVAVPEGIHLAARTVGDRNHLQVAAAWVAVVEIEGAPHARTWYERDPVRAVGSAMSLSVSVPGEVRSRRCRCTQHLVARTRQGRCHKAGNSGYADPPSLPFSQHPRSTMKGIVVRWREYSCAEDRKGRMQKNGGIRVDRRERSGVASVLFKIRSWAMEMKREERK